MSKVKVKRIAPSNYDFEQGEIYDAEIVGHRVNVFYDKENHRKYFYTLESDAEGVSYKDFFEIVDNEDMKFREMLQHGTKNRE